MILIALLLMVLSAPQAHAASDLSEFAYDQHPGAQLPVAERFRDHPAKKRHCGRRRRIGQRSWRWDTSTVQTCAAWCATI